MVKILEKKHQPTSTNIISGFQPVDSHLTLENANLKTAPGSPKPADFFEELRMQQLSKVFDHKDRMVGWDGMGWDGMGWDGMPTSFQFFPTLAIESSCPTRKWQLFFGF